MPRRSSRCRFRAFTLVVSAPKNLVALARNRRPDTRPRPRAGSAALVQNTLAVGKLAGLVAFLVLGFAVGRGDSAQLSSAGDAQIVVLNYSDNNGVRQAGLTFSDRTDRPIIEFVNERDSIMKLPDGPAKTEALRLFSEPVRNGVVQAAPRVFIGRDRARSSLLRLSDPMGRPRLVLRVDSMGAPQLEFLDGSGRVTSRLPER